MAYEPPEDGESVPEDNEPENRYSSDSARPGSSGTSGSVGGSKKADPGDYGTLPRSYLNVLTKARREIYEEEIPNAGWGKTLLGVALVTLVTFGMKIVLAPATLEALNNYKLELAKQGIYSDVDPQKTVFQLLEDSTNPLYALIVPITFFLGSALLYMLARAVRDKETDSRPGVSFMTHSYLLSLSYTPLRILSGLVSGLSLMPIAGCLAILISLGLGIYQLYNVGVSMQASQNLDSGKAQMVAFVPWVVGVILAIMIVILIAVSYGLSFSR